MKLIDLRSDTVTRPTAAMRAAMASADVGDDVFGEDPTVNRLEELAAGMLGTEAAIFAASGTQSNLMGLLAQCGRGDEYIVGQQAHTYRYEGGGAAVLGSIQPQPLDFAPDGTLDLAQVAAAIKPDDCHFARTRLLCLENTQAGRALPLAYFPQARQLARQHRLNLHLDGARLFNAAVRLEVPASQMAGHFDSISVCLSKGLGAPVGSLLCATREIVASARRWRKMLGGGMRQAGILAAAGIYALEHQVGRLAEDHANAALLARLLGEIDELSVETAPLQTNMVFVNVPRQPAAGLEEFLRPRGIVIIGGERLRLVTHLDVSTSDVRRTGKAFKDYFQTACPRGSRKSVRN